MDEVRFVIDGETLAIDERAATILAENLRLTAAGEYGDTGRDGARDLADAIEAVLTDAALSVTVDDVTGDALFYALNMPGTGDSPTFAALYAAARTVHERRHGIRHGIA